MATFNRLCSLSGEFKSLSATDITDIMVVRTLLRSLDDSFAHLVMMIKERPDFRDIKPADIIERLKTHEMEEEERRAVNGPSRRSHALKAKVSKDSSSEVESVSACESDDPESMGKDLALVIKRFSRFQKNWSPKKNSSSRHSRNYSRHHSPTRSHPPSKENSCYKCKKSGHFIADCPMWEVEAKSKYGKNNASSKSYKSSKSYEPKKYESKSRRDKKNDSDDDKKKKYHKKRESSSSKSHSSRRRNSHRAKAYLGKEMNSEDEASGSEAESETR